MAEQFRRKTPEELLQTIAKMNRGRLTILLGPVSGSGKTYHMLHEGEQLKKRGIDVVIGVVSSGADGQHAVIGQCSLEAVPAVEWRDRGVCVQDLDVEAILQRNPEVVLVDSLAHRNRPGAVRPTRLEDVKYLLEHKISVITTVNIYELAGSRDLAEKLLKETHVPPGECVPDDTLALADEVNLVDVTPEVILKRLQEGSIASKEAENFAHDKLFRRDNLSILRELALRVVAEEVNEALEEYRDRHGLIGPSGASERVLVTVQYHWNGSTLVHRAQQVAKRLGADLLVVCFRSKGSELSREATAIKRAIVELTEKLGGVFAEQVTDSRRTVAEAIRAYATTHNVTRIVMGQSKRSRWEEIVHGSIINKILRKTRNIDVFIVAERLRTGGERVFTARRKDALAADASYRRLSAEAVSQALSQLKRGTLKVYLGAAPGVGKTYRMLREANELKKQGIDVVVGLLETHGRKETIEQIGSLEVLPRKQVCYKNTHLTEMDTAAVIARNPEVVLVDELAHTNVPGSRFAKRYEDVELLLQAGISVISTMNVQHLESLSDSVEQITGIRVRETVPDHILRLADEIELIDISPQALRKRMREGNIYTEEKIAQSLENFFKTGNLIALRELALREVANDVDERLEAGEQQRVLQGAGAEESVFVCVNLRPDSERLIRRGFRAAFRLKAPWRVVHICGPTKRTEVEDQQLAKCKSLTERLGGRFEMYEAADERRIFRVLVEQIQRTGATQVVIGHSARTRMQEIVKGSVVQRLLREIRHTDVLVVADHSPAP